MRRDAPCLAGVALLVELAVRLACPLREPLRLHAVHDAPDRVRVEPARRPARPAAMLISFRLGFASPSVGLARWSRDEERRRAVGSPLPAAFGRLDIGPQRRDERRIEW